MAMYKVQRFFSVILQNDHVAVQVILTMSLLSSVQREVQCYQSVCLSVHDLIHNHTIHCTTMRSYLTSNNGDILYIDTNTSRLS